MEEPIEDVRRCWLCGHGVEQGELIPDDIDWIHAECRKNVDKSVKSILAKQELQKSEQADFHDE